MTTIEENVHKGFSVGNFFRASLRNYSALWLLVIFIILFSITANGTFNRPLTAQIVLSDQITTALLALALLIPLTAHQFDLAVGALLSLSMSVTAVTSVNGWPIWQGALLGIAAATLCGLGSGLIIAKLNVNSFIATLGMSQVATAVAYMLTRNEPIAPVLPYWFTSVTRGTLFGLSFDIYYLLIIAVIAWFVLEHTPVGRSLFAAGGNPEAARLAGVRVDRLTIVTFICSGFIAGLAGVLLLSKVGQFSQDYGAAFLFGAFAAVFFGATQIKGRPNVWGTLLAVYVLAVAVAGLQLTFFGNDYWLSPLFNGIALIIAVALASRKHAGSAYKKLRKGKKPPENAPIEDSAPAVPLAADRE